MIVQQQKRIAHILVGFGAVATLVRDAAQREMSDDKTRVQVERAAQRLDGRRERSTLLKNQRTQVVGGSAELLRAEPLVTAVERFGQSALVGQSASPRSKCFRRGIVGDGRFEAGLRWLKAVLDLL